MSNTRSRGVSYPHRRQRSGNETQDSPIRKRARQLINDFDQSSEEAAGKVLKIKLTNFMCHANFEITFGNRINFLSGKNGSGKSAISTALVVGLGARTSDTNRGQSMSQLIKTGEHKAVIEIVLLNVGRKSYHQEEYGDHFSIIRSILLSGTSSYKIKTQKGEIKTLKKIDLNLILLHFNIQVSNPICILNQDTARTFLKSTTPKTLYKLFEKGTSLDQIKSIKESLLEDTIPQLGIMAKKRERIAQDEYQELLKYMEIMKVFDELKELQLEENDLQNLLNWIEVDEITNDYIKIETKLKESRNSLLRYKNNIETENSYCIELRDKNTKFTEELETFKTNGDQMARRSIDLQQKLSYSKDQIASQISSIATLKKKCDKGKSYCKTLKDEINRRISQSEEIEKQKKVIEERIADCMRKSTELNAVKETMSVHKQQLQDTWDEVTTQVDNSNQHCSKISRDITVKTNYLQHLEKSSNSLSVFGNWMPQLLRTIDTMDREGRFDQKPLGPIGMFIKLKDKSWGPAIESNFSSRFLQSFCVASAKDFYLVNGILEKMNVKKAQQPSFYITRFFNKVHDVSRTETRYPNYENLLNSIEISHPVIANIIIDQTNVDTILLIPTRDETYHLMEVRENVPRNCLKVLTKGGDLFFPYPNYRCYAGHVATSTRFLQVSTEEAISLTRRELGELQLTLNKQRIKFNELRERQNVIKAELDSALKRFANINRNIAENEKNLIDLRDRDMPETFISCSTLENDLQQRKNMVETTISEIEAAIKKKDELVQGHEAISEEKNALEASIKAQTKEMEKILGKIKKNKDKLKKYNIDQDKSLEVVKKLEFEINVLSSKLSDTNTNLSKATDAATVFCPNKIPTDRDKASVKRSLCEVKCKRSEMEESVGPKPPKPKDLEVRLERFKTKSDNIKEFSEVQKVLKWRTLDLASRLEDVRDLVSHKTKIAFKEILKHKKFNGDMEINHENGTLALNVQPDSSSSKAVLSTLSGGERSYSTVALIIALWNNMSTPFYFLDEFDVFMDGINRKTVLDLLVSQAKFNPNKQFVFLTPHAIHKDDSENVKVLRMEDPRPNKQ